MRTAREFWRKVDKTGSCWLWTGATDGRYGQVEWKGRPMKAHRVAWRLGRGGIPWGLNVLHHCDNPLCVRAGHLFVGTQSDNLLDAKAKGRCGFQTKPELLARGDKHGSHTHPERLARGERNGFAKLTEDQVRMIRKRRALGVTYELLAAELGVNPVTVSRICKGKGWAHV